MTPFEIVQALNVETCNQCRKFKFNWACATGDLSVAANRAAHMITPTPKILSTIQKLRDLKEQMLSDMKIHLETCGVPVD